MNRVLKLIYINNILKDKFLNSAKHKEQHYKTYENMSIHFPMEKQILKCFRKKLKIRFLCQSVKCKNAKASYLFRY